MPTTDRPEKQLHKVTSVESPEVLILDSGMRIRLIGIRTNPHRAAKAVEALTRLAVNQMVFMNEDKVKLDLDGVQLGYVYLENGLFLNALLVKYDLVDVDEATPFRYRERFLKRQRDNRAS